MQRYFLHFAYNGRNYCGFQIQPNAMTVQERLETALSTLLRRPQTIVGAGRTDTGVHASSMAAHFELDEPLEDTHAFVERLNRLLPPDIWAQSLRPVRKGAHARFDALSRTYKYYVVTHKQPFRHDTTLRIYYPLDLEKMNQAAKLLFNYEDFTSFSKLHTDVKTNNCTLMQAYWEQEPDGTMVFTVQANRFLRNMVRAMVGTLIDVGRGKITPEQVCQILELKDRGKAGVSVHGQALFLVDVEYPDELYLD